MDVDHQPDGSIMSPISNMNQTEDESMDINSQGQGEEVKSPDGPPPLLNLQV